MPGQSIFERLQESASRRRPSPSRDRAIHATIEPPCTRAARPHNVTSHQCARLRAAWAAAIAACTWHSPTSTAGAEHRASSARPRRSHRGPARAVLRSSTTSSPRAAAARGATHSAQQRGGTGNLGVLGQCGTQDPRQPNRLRRARRARARNPASSEDEPSVEDQIEHAQNHGTATASASAPASRTRSSRCCACARLMRWAMVASGTRNALAGGVPFGGQRQRDRRGVAQRGVAARGPRLPACRRARQDADVSRATGRALHAHR